MNRTGSRGKALQFLTVSTVAAATAFGVVSPAVAQGLDPESITACSFKPKKVTITPAMAPDGAAGSRWVKESFEFTDTDADADGKGRAWLESYVNGSYFGGWAVEVLASNTVPYFWADILAGHRDELRYYALDEAGARSGDVLCTLTVTYRVTGTRPAP